MSEKDEVICLAHSSVDCSKKSTYSFEDIRGCNLGVNHADPFTSNCRWRHVIKVPQKPAELPDISVVAPTKPAEVSTSEELPF